MTQEDREAMGEIDEAYAAAFRRKDARGLAALFTEDATALTEWGDVLQGRATFEKMLTGAFANMPGELGLKTTLTHVRAVTPDVIIVHGMAWKVVSGAEETLYYSRVLVRQGEKWQIAAVQVAPPSEMPDPRE